MKTKEIIGIDVSKNKLDLYCSQEKTTYQIDNDLKSIEDFMASRKNAIVAFENTGMYSNLMRACCISEGITFFEIPAIKIKRSAGLVRGKNDQIDAKRIADYIARYGDTLTPTTAIEENIERLKMLIGLRKSYVAMAAEIKGRLPQRQVFHQLKKSDFIHKTEKTTFDFLNKKIQSVELEISQLIDQDPGFKRNFDLITSIVGVGEVIATTIIAATHNFCCFKDPRKFACHAGVAPFPHTSGSSIRGKTKTSKMANKAIKTLLHQGARSAILNDPQLKKYYQRKIAEGKNGMSVINAVCFKLITRIFAVIKRDSPYVKLQMI